jgi:hypothetical protein
VEAAIDVILADVLKNGVTQKELDRVRNQAIRRVYTLIIRGAGPHGGRGTTTGLVRAFSTVTSTSKK